MPSEEIIDVAEYFGRGPDDTPSGVHYHQLKHSSVRVDDPITSSELGKTLSKFADIYRDALAAGSAANIRFSFVSNRLLNAKVRQSLTDLRSGRPPSHATEGNYLRDALGFGAERTAEQKFFDRFTVNDGVPGVEHTERILTDEFKDYLPGGGTGSELADLMNHISRMATHEAKSNTLTRHDLLVILRTTEDQLFPALPAFEDLEHVIETPDVDRIASILRSGNQPKLLITAHGGVGKSIFVGMLKDKLEDVSSTLLFDSFAGGDYRQLGKRRHQHRIALTQLANELAGRGLCTALIPSQVAEPGDYLNAFESKVRKACASQPESLITIVIDAADNAVMAASAFRERPFIADLFDISWPANFRLVALCRPERKELLGLPGDVPEIELSGFDQTQTMAHLRTRFPTSTGAQGAQLHVLSTGNPRVQAMALEGAQSADDAISTLQIATNRPGAALDALFADQVQNVVAQGHLLRDELDRLCQALATLHPTIPLSDLALIAEVSEDAIRSFAVALGRGLHFNNNSLQFRDEPTETWFTNNYSLTPLGMRSFATRVIPHSSASAYIASILPQLLFEAGMVDELVELALSDGGLPTGIDDLQAQEIARARSRFALGSALRAQRYDDAALLAVKAGTLSSGHARRMKMFRANPDIAARFLDRDVIDSLCSGRELTDEWPGSNLHVEAVMLSSLDERRDLGRARLTASYNTIRAILRLDSDELRDLHAQITPKEIASLAIAMINIDGASAAVRFLSGWRPREFVREASAMFASRLADAGRANELSAVVALAEYCKHIQIAVTETMFDYGIVPSNEATAALAVMLKDRSEPFRHRSGPYVYDADLRGVTWALLHALRIAAITEDDARRVLEVHLVPLRDHAGESWSGLLPTSCILGHALKARLSKKHLEVGDVVMPEFLERLLRDSPVEERHSRAFKQNITPLLPWATCLVDAVLDGPVDSVRLAVSTLAANDFATKHNYDPPFVRLNGMAEIAIKILSLMPDPIFLAQFEAWHKASGHAITRSQLAVIRCAARNPDLASFAIAAVNRALDASQKDRLNADARVDEIIELARAILATSESESRAIFNIADREAKLVGDDLPARWYALTNTARRLGSGTEPERAYRLLQIGETLGTDEGSDISRLATPLFEMHPPSYYAAVSRQRDRRALAFDRLLEPIMSNASKLGTPIGALAVTALGAPDQWQAVTEALPAQEAARLDGVYRQFTSHSRRGGEIPLEDRSASTSRDWAGSKQTDPTKVVGPLDFTTAEGWDGAFAKVDWYSDARRTVVRLALGKLPAKLAEAIRAIADSTGAREEDFVIAATYASEQTPSAGLMESLDYLADVFADRFAATIATRHYDRPDLEKFAEAAGVPQRRLLEAGFAKLGEKAHTLNHEEYFSLASHLARTLQVPKAALVFDALAALFDDLAPPAKASDGLYANIAQPPADLAICLAGLIWAALGDMAIARRWEASQAVLLLVEVGDQATLNELAKFADGTHDPAPFYDARFAHYVLHSRTWLLFALERAGSEPTANLLAAFVPWLLELVDGPPHAANQVLAQRTLQVLADRGAVAPTPEWADPLARRLFAEWDELDWSAQSARQDPFQSEVDAPSGNGGHPFFYDFRQSWAAHLGRVFGTSDVALAMKAEVIACDLTGYDDGYKDPRHDAGVFNQRGSYPDHRNWPQEEDFAFYSAVHAILSLAADLASTLKAFKDQNADLDEYTSWLNEFLPKRRDGRWLSDRRDSPPVPAPELRIMASTNDTWRWSLTPSDFESAVAHGTDWIVVDASYATTLGERSEEVDISSALIHHATANSYLTALQTNALGGLGALPTTDDNCEDDIEGESPFRLVPWIDGSYFEESIDRDDERGRNVTFPPPRPCAEIVDRFALVTDNDLRVWSNRAREVFRSRVWDNTERTSREHSTGTSGTDLVVDWQFLKEVLNERDMTLVVQVRLRRDVHRSSYDRKESDEIPWIEWSSKVYLIDPEGRWTEY
ncbi:hypothetical protein [Luteipulveratus halotolerans]|uniref:hypothetical protein n=1 Tax=Luteipulveratus halotolerans TaxID=1631356 RepID=UPI0012F75B78|nr:hypothetical protein [Luteipulveratus halotolerans]